MALSGAVSRSSTALKSRVVSPTRQAHVLTVGSPTHPSDAVCFAAAEASATTQSLARKSSAAVARASTCGSSLPQAASGPEMSSVQVQVLTQTRFGPVEEGGSSTTNKQPYGSAEGGSSLGLQRMRSITAMHPRPTSPLQGSFVKSPSAKAAGSADCCRTLEAFGCSPCKRKVLPGAACPQSPVAWGGSIPVVIADMAGGPRFVNTKTFIGSI